MSMSARSMGMGSVGISELPMRVTACFTSGNCAFRIFSACVSLAPRYMSLLMPMWWHTASTMMTAPSKPEVYCTEAHQVSAHAEELHHAECEQHGQWDDGGYHKSCAVVAEEQYEDKDHNQPLVTAP